MSFDFDPTGPDDFQPMQIDKIERVDDSSDRRNDQALVRIDHDLCEDSGVCAQVCPEDVIEYTGGHSSIVKPDACTECWICVENCSTGAIDIG